jgi:gliding motility-associated-like protein
MNLTIYSVHLPSLIYCRRSVFFALLMLFFAQTSHAQLTNSQCTGTGILPGKLNVSATAGCVPLRILTSSSGGTGKNVRYIYYYKGGVPIETDAIRDSAFVYNKAGTYYLMQLSDDPQGKPMRACATITVQDTIAPNFKVVYCANGQVTLTLPTDVSNIYDNYGVDWGDGAVQIIAKAAKITTHKYATQKTYRISLQGIHSVGKCGGVAVKSVTPIIITEAPKLTRLEMKDMSVAELTFNNPNEIPLLVYSQTGSDVFKSTGRTVRLPSEKVQVLADSNNYVCFKASPIDTCITKLESNVLCTTFLKAQVIDESRNFLSIIPYRYPSEVKSVAVLRDNKPWKTLGVTDLWIEDFAPDCKKNTCYKVQMETQYGTVISNEKCMTPPLVLCTDVGDIFVPDVFTPNNDGVNDVLEIKGEIPRDYQLTIFSAAGQPIFTSNATQKSWNGYVDGVPTPTGMYLYRIRISDKIGRIFIKRGTFTLLR